MSAFLCSQDHFGALARYASDQEIRIYHNREPGKWPEGPPLEAWTERGQVELILTLVLANLESLQTRYPDLNGVRDWGHDEGREGFLELCQQQARLPLNRRPGDWHREGRQLHANIIKMCQCLDYQSCEFAGWQDSPAYRIVEAIKAQAVRRALAVELDRAPWDLGPFVRRKLEAV